MYIRKFGVEMWMNAHESNCTYNLAETCVASLTVDKLIALTGRNDDILSDILQMKMTYGAIEGSDRLRNAISALYTNQSRENIVVTHGTIGANALVYKTLVSAGDHVISVLPTYQQHYSIPESIDAEVETLQLREEDGFLPDLSQLADLIRPTTRLIALTNPNNPTGALIDLETLKRIIEIAQSSRAYILCDEVYRGTAQEGDGMGVAVADLYERGISTGGMSKAFSLAGLRLGWITARQDIIGQVMIHRDYDTISVGMLDDHFATMALESRAAILERSQAITRANLTALDDWISNEPHLSYVKPKAATICLLKYDIDMPSHELCVDILNQTGVLLTPGSAFDMEGYVRIGFANDTKILKAGLARLSEYFRRFD